MIEGCLAAVVAGLLATGGPAAAVRAGQPLQRDASPAAARSTVAERISDPPDWELAVSVYGYFVPDDSDFAQPTLAADRGWLHLEARYNYEDLDTFSGWLGYNFEVGDEVRFAATPMIGGVVGDTSGLAPGLDLALEWWWLGIYSESEWVIDIDERADSFAYTWSEITLAPLDWLRAGMVVQRTRTHDAGRDISRGILVSVTAEPVAITFHVFNPDLDKPTWVLAIALDFQ